MSTVWTCARVPPSVPHVPDLLSLPKPAGRDPRGDQGKLVGGSQACGIRDTFFANREASTNFVRCGHAWHGFLRADSGGVMGYST